MYTFLVVPSCYSSTQVCPKMREDAGRSCGHFTVTISISKGLVLLRSLCVRSSLVCRGKGRERDRMSLMYLLYA